MTCERSLAMRAYRLIVALSLIAATPGCGPDSQSGKKAPTPPAPSAAPAVKGAMTKVAPTTKAAEPAKPKSRVADVNLPSGLGLGLSSGSSFGNDVESINPVKIDASSTFQKSGVVPRAAGR
jgi:hypothetical protein